MMPSPPLPPCLSRSPPSFPPPLLPATFFHAHFPLLSLASVQAETTALKPVDFADIELKPPNEDNLRLLMHEDVLAYRPELRSPAAGSSLPDAVS